jgi:hypothetical protein
VNTFFLTVMGALVFVMHAGFAMVSILYMCIDPCLYSPVFITCFVCNVTAWYL